MYTVDGDFHFFFTELGILITNLIPDWGITQGKSLLLECCLGCAAPWSYRKACVYKEYSGYLLIVILKGIHQWNVSWLWGFVSVSVVACDITQIYSNYLSLEDSYAPYHNGWSFWSNVTKLSICTLSQLPFSIKINQSKCQKGKSIFKGSRYGCIDTSGIDPTSLVSVKVLVCFNKSACWIVCVWKPLTGVEKLQSLELWDTKHATFICSILRP